MRTASTGSMAFSDSTDPTRSGSSPPSSPPMEPPAVIRPMVRRAVLGSNRSLMMAQNPETRIARRTGRSRGDRPERQQPFRAEPTRAHSASSRAALRAYNRGTDERLGPRHDAGNQDRKNSGKGGGGDDDRRQCCYAEAREEEGVASSLPRRAGG